MSKLAKRPLLLIVRDGWGHNPHPEWNHANAVHLARTPVDHRLRSSYPWVRIRTSGEDVGLPAGVMGNSEVGHQNIGAGRIVDQEQMRITRTIRDGSFFDNEVLKGAFQRKSMTEARVHLIGLCSDAGVHSALEHLYALLEMARGCGHKGDSVLLHAIGDGRDSPPTSGVEYIRAIEAKMRALGIGRVATVIGRYYAMDRDNRWDRVEKAYRLMTGGEGVRVKTAEEAFTRYYAKPTSPNLSGDEFIEPTVVTPSPSQGEGRGEGGDASSRLHRNTIRPSESVIFFNFRGDRPREITKAFVYDKFPFTISPPSLGGAGRGSSSTSAAPISHGFNRGPKLDNLYYCTICDYEKGLPVQVAFPRPPKMTHILGAYWSSLGLRQFRCAETEKYPHVTFFFNDYRDEPFAGEDRQIIPSPRDVATYDQKPQMSAYEVTDEMLRRIASDQYDLFVLNYANGDMVGHTGVLPAAIQAVEAVDACVGRVVEAVLAQGGSAIVTADHGNCEQMIDPATGGPHTAHTTYDVDLIVVDDRYKGAYDLTTGKPTGTSARGGTALREGGRLADIAPTLLKLAGVEQPAEMTGRPLF